MVPDVHRGLNIPARSDTGPEVYKWSASYELEMVCVEFIDGLDSTSLRTRSFFIIYSSGPFASTGFVKSALGPLNTLTDCTT